MGVAKVRIGLEVMDNFVGSKEIYTTDGKSRHSDAADHSLALAVFPGLHPSQGGGMGMSLLWTLHLSYH